METLNMLYYSNAFIANHGGRLHSEAFFREAKKNEKINTILIHPTPSQKSSNSASKTNWLRNKLKGNSLFQVIFFFRRNYLSFNEIEPIIRRNAIDCLHIRLDSNFLIINKLRNIFPEILITTEVNASPFDENFKNIAFRTYFKKKERKSLMNASANFFVSGYLRESIMKTYDENRDFVVHNGVDLEMFKFNEQKTEREIVTFGYVGTIDYHKNLIQLIDAFYFVHIKFPKKVKLIIVGDGPMLLELKQYVKTKNLTAIISFEGWVKHENIVDYLSEMDIAIHHSAHPYMSPLKIFEYLAFGLPVIGPDTPAVREILNNDIDLVLVKSEANDIADKMIDLYLDRDKRYRIARTGQEKIRSDFGWKSNVENILSVIQNKII